MRRADRGRARATWCVALAIGLWLSGGTGLAAPPPGPMADPLGLVSRAKDVRIERRIWDEKDSALRTVASGRVNAAWLGRLIRAGLPASGRLSETRCAVACRRCPEQLAIEVTFSAASKRHFLSLHMREGLAFLRADSAAAWSFADSLGPVLALLREGLSKDATTQAWTPPPIPPAPLDPDSAAYREDDILVTGMPEQLLKAPPIYPLLAREGSVEGTVEIRALVKSDGTVDRARIAKSVPILDAAALESVQQWTFKPATCGGRPVPVWVLVPVRFRLR